MKTPRAIFIRLLLCSALCAATASGGQAQTEDREQASAELQQVSDKINQVDAQLKRNAAQISRYQTEIESSERAIFSTRKKIADERLTLTRLDTELLKLEAEQQVARNELASEAQRIKTLLRALFANRDSDTLKLLLSQDNPANLARNLAFHARVLKQQNIQIDALMSLLAKLDQTQKELAQNRQDRERTLTALESEEQNLSRQQQERTQQVAALQQMTQSLQVQKQQLEQDQARLQNLIDELDTLALTNETIQIAPFADQKGKLQWPTEAKVSTRFNSKRNTNVRWQGMRFSNIADDPIRPIYHGRVVFADWLRGYGLLVIIDHGENYMSLYAHNNSISVEEGQWVDPSTVIALAGNTGGQEEPGLYFEVRHQGEPQNPAHWCR